jgi:REP element-mobilizing transposase RayT
VVIAYHLIGTGYGCWLPNDPRGSTSLSIRNNVLRELGDLHVGRKRVQPAPRDIRAFYENAKDLLRHPLLTFDDHDIGMIARLFAEVIRDEGYTCFACALMPDHVHLVIRKHRHHAEEMIANLQWGSAGSVRLLNRCEPEHPVWGGPGWKVFLDTADDIRRTLKYVEDNPPKARLPAQQWEFVVPYDGWPFHNRVPSP